MDKKNETTETKTAAAIKNDFMDELLKNGYVTLKAKTRDELAAMVNDIPADIKYAVGAVGQNYDEGCFTLRVDLISKK